MTNLSPRGLSYAELFIYSSTTQESLRRAQDQPREEDLGILFYKLNRHLVVDQFLGERDRLVVVAFVDEFSYILGRRVIDLFVVLSGNGKDDKGNLWEAVVEAEDTLEEVGGGHTGFEAVEDVLGEVLGLLLGHFTQLGESFNKL